MLKLLLMLSLACQLTADAVRSCYPVTKNDLTAFYRMQAQEGLPMQRPVLAGKELTQGQVGYLAEGFVGDLKRPVPNAVLKVVQVVDANKMLVRLENMHHVVRLDPITLNPTAKIEKTDTIALLDGYDSEGVTDGKTLEISDCLIVDGTYQYTAVSGAAKTIPVLKKTELPPMPAHPAMLGVGVREWKDATGKFSVQAAYDGYERGKVFIVRESDGKRIEVEMSNLDKDSQKFVRDELKRKADEEKEAKRKRS